jgi:hypothetical protein
MRAALAAATREERPREELLVGDLILCEVLQDLRTDSEARLVEDALREFEVVSLIDAELAVKAAANYRFLLS